MTPVPAGITSEKAILVFKTSPRLYNKNCNSCINFSWYLLNYTVFQKKTLILLSSHEFCRHTLLTFPCKLWTFGIKFSLTVETTVFNSQQLFLLCLLIYIIYSLTVMTSVLIKFAVTVFQCSLTLSVTCSRCEAL